jgi:hypothetical protein
MRALLRAGRNQAPIREVAVKIVGVVGLPGSGKSAWLSELREKGAHVVDDIGKDWSVGLAEVRKSVSKGVRVAVSDIEFCDARRREAFERDVGSDVQWLYFANEPVQCVKNCIYRYENEDSRRPILEEIEKILRLSRVYCAPGDARSVWRP